MAGYLIFTLFDNASRGLLFSILLAKKPVHVAMMDIYKLHGYIQLGIIRVTFTLQDGYEAWVTPIGECCRIDGFDLIVPLE